MTNVTLETICLTLKKTRFFRKGVDTVMGLTMMISFKEDNKELEKNESTKRNMLWGMVNLL